MNSKARATPQGKTEPEQSPSKHTDEIEVRVVGLPLWIRAGDRTKRWMRISVYLAILGTWQLTAFLDLPVARWVSSPYEIGVALWEIAASGELWSDMIASLSRVGAGFGVGSAIGLSLGFLLGWSKRAEDLIMGVLTAIYPLPKLAILPLLVIWFGIGMGSKVALIAFGCFFYVCLNTFSGVRMVDPVLVKAALNSGANRRQLLRYVVLPSAIPNIMTGLKLGAGYSLALVVAAEMIAARDGLGHMVLLAGQFLQIDRLMAGVVVFGLLGLAFYRLADLLEMALTPWRRASQ